MFAKLFLQYVLAAAFGVGVDEGFATLYGTPGDPNLGESGTMACTGREVPQDERLCAHRWLPCGTEVMVVNLERPGVTTCKVADRGPFGKTKGGQWRGIIDLTPGSARGAKLDGRDLVRIIYKLPPAGHKVYGNARFLRPKPAKGTKPMARAARSTSPQT